MSTESDDSFAQPNQEYMESLDFIENDSIEDVSMENDSIEDVSIENDSIVNDSMVNDSIRNDSIGNDSIGNDTNQSMDLDESAEPLDVNSNVKNVFNCGDTKKVEKTTRDFYEYVRKYVKTLGITFQFSKKLTSAVKEGLKLWFKVDSLTKKQLDFASNFARHVPIWYKKAKNDARLFAAHQGKYLSTKLTISQGHLLTYCRTYLGTAYHSYYT